MFSQNIEKTSNIEEVIIKNKHNADLKSFLTSYKKQKIYYRKYNSSIKGEYKKENILHNIEGNFIVSTFLGVNSYAPKFSNIDVKEFEQLLKKVIHISHSHYKILNNDHLIRNFYCKKLEQNSWEFIAVKNNLKEKIKLNDESDYKMQIVLDEQGAIKLIKSILKDSNSSYDIKIQFTSSKNILSFNSIEVNAISNDNHLNALINLK